MDLIDGYPGRKDCFYRLLHDGCERSKQKGLGSAIISEVTDYLKSINYLAIRLAWAKGNPQEHFWLKNGFSAIKETSSTAAAHVILAEKNYSLFFIKSTCSYNLDRLYLIRNRI